MPTPRNEVVFLQLMYGTCRLYLKATKQWKRDAALDQTPGGLLAVKRVVKLFVLIEVVKKFFWSKHAYAINLSKPTQEHCDRLSDLVLIPAENLLAVMSEQSKSLNDEADWPSVYDVAFALDATSPTFKEIFGEYYEDFAKSWDLIDEGLDQMKAKHDFLEGVEPRVRWLDHVLSTFDPETHAV